MDDWLRVLTATLAVFGVVGLGGLLRRVNWLNENADTSLLKLVVNVLFPCLILRSIVGNPALDQAENVWLPPLVGFGVTALTIGLSGAAAWWLGPALGLRSAAARRTFALAAGMHNYGYLPVPLAESLYPAAAGEASGAGSGVLGVLFVNNVGVDLAMWTLGVAVVSGSLGWSGLRRMVNGPSIAVVAALMLHVVGAKDLLPGATGFVWKAIGMLAVCAVPVALLLIGATMVDALAAMRQQSMVADQSTTPAGRRINSGGGGVWRTMGGACGLRLGVLPVVLLAVAWGLPWVGGTVELQRVQVLHSAMPAAVFPIVLARHYGGDASTATLVSLSTSAVSLLTMPVWLAVGSRWLGV